MVEISLHQSFLQWILIREYKNKSKWLSLHPQLTMAWSWDFISSNPGITMEDIDNSLKTRDAYSKKWDWSEISTNPNVTPEFLNKYKKKPWDWYTHYLPQ